MFRALAYLFVLVGGATLMVLEIIGARYLARFFGGSFYVWTGQISVVLLALAIGYWAGGQMADRFKRLKLLLIPLLITGTICLLMPELAPRICNWIIQRHPAQEPVPELWRKLDPALGSATVFFVPCLVLAMLSPYTIRVLTIAVDRVGRIAGNIYAASTFGNIAGVICSAYWLIDKFEIPDIFRISGVACVILAFTALILDRLYNKTDCEAIGGT